MKYQKASNILPDELVALIQDYVQGTYIYIPVRDKLNSQPVTDYKIELERRNRHIYLKHLEGMRNQHLAGIYNLSESSIRRIIIQQRKEHSTMTERINSILSNWGLHNSKITQIYHTTWQIGDHYVLKAYDGINSLLRNLKILQILDEMQIPVGKIVPANDNRLYVSDDSYLYFLSIKLSGNNIVQIDNNLPVADMMGEIIADLHIAFQKCENMDIFWDNSLLDEMNGWVKNSLAHGHWKYISQDQYEKAVSSLAGKYDQLPVQLIHRDVHFGNFLFANGQFSGYIDFDLSQRNIRIFDICYFLLGLLSEEEKLNISKEQWFDIAKSIFAGYERKLPLSHAEKKAVPHVMACIELLFVAYFEDQNDTCCAENAYEIFKFVQSNEERIWNIIP